MSSAVIIPFQLPLRQALPTIHGNLDYRNFREQLLRFDQLLLQSGLESQFVEADLQQWLARQPRPTTQRQQKRQFHSRRALRCNLARLLLTVDYRGFAARLADSPVLQHFCLVGELESVTVPSKSTLQRYQQWWPEAQVRELARELIRTAADRPEQLGLTVSLDLEQCFLDTTCLEAPIHFPVDWVLLRDATRTLMKAVELIREHGLKHRMEPPQSFRSRMNKLCIQMTHAFQAANGQRQRKRTLRVIDRLVGVVRQHARRYRHLLDVQWEQTDWTRRQVEQVLRRMDQVLDRLPQARRQARERILAGRQVPNREKILSLYEPDVHVIVRRKAGAEVEFGNTLLVAENPQGLLLDWLLFRDSAPADSGLLPTAVVRLEEAYGRPKAIAADRGFDSHDNQEALEGDGIYNAVCPRSPQQLQERCRSWKFKQLQTRRGQTEARIGILKNVFQAGQMRCKGFVHRELTVTWTALIHNLWVLARLPRRNAEADRAQAA